ncbi:ComEC/Rec2 family competence protein [Microbacterium sp. zg-YB36]|uniref:ComEC/Rec2 family competence protein n=1 Tax=Microbacterium sp. zg-YB36 TaxID=2969407 RepID=UPI00214CC979|nr:ComEC/Rec2 family competence protein [Microbacterium sp. zg-YB36]MDL5350323.1 ComEC/Rec2 family competence protein [Microbacterium sp. zg-YB36]
MSLGRARRRDLRLVPAAAGAWAAALLGAAHADAAAGAAVVVWVLCFGALALAVATPRARTVATVVVITCAGAAAALSHLSLAQAGRTTDHLAIDGGRALRVQATVTGKVEPSAGGLGFDAVAERIGIGPDEYPVSLPVTVRVAPGDVTGHGALAPGARIEVLGTAFPADPGERAVLVLQAGTGLTVLAAPQGALAAAAHLRQSLVASTSDLPPPGANLVPGLAVGDTSAVSEQLDAAMKTSSLSHLTAVSGANCALVVGIAFAAAALCGARRGIRVAVALVALAGFVVLVTPEPSVVRAAVMAGIAMLGVMLGRVGAGLSVLCLAVLVLLVGDPWLAGEMGFTLSAAATASLLLLAGPLADGISRWMPRPLALALSLPLAAQLVCGPLLIVLEPSVSLYGIAANLLVAPAAPIATIVGLAACMAAPFPLVQSGLAALAWVPAAWIAGTADTVSRLPAASVPWPEGGWGVVLLATVGAAIAVVCIARGATPLLRTVRAGSALMLALLLGVGAGGAALSSVLGPLTVPSRWTVAACDVGQADAVLVRSAGAIALIDTGPDRDALEGCLHRFGVDRVDLLVLTHFDADHIGGAEALAGRVDVVLHGPALKAGARATLRRLLDAGARLVAGTTDAAGQLGDARWRVLWPPTRSAAFASGNDASVVLEVVGGDVPSSLFLGDLSAAPQRALLASGELLSRYHAVKVAHHGSADQADELYRALRPAVAVVTVGADNEYGHPRAEILNLLANMGATIARTDRDGIVVLSTDERGVGVWRERAPPLWRGPLAKTGRGSSGQERDEPASRRRRATRTRAAPLRSSSAPPASGLTAFEPE